MTKSSVSQDESLLLPPEPREPCRKPAASAGDVSVLCSGCCMSPRDWGSEGRPLRPGPRAQVEKGLLGAGEGNDPLSSPGAPLLPSVSETLCPQLARSSWGDPCFSDTQPCPRSSTGPQRPEREAVCAHYHKASNVCLRHGPGPPALRTLADLALPPCRGARDSLAVPRTQGLPAPVPVSAHQRSRRP